MQKKVKLHHTTNETSSMSGTLKFYEFVLKYPSQTKKNTKKIIFIGKKLEKDWIECRYEIIINCKS